MDITQYRTDSLLAPRDVYRTPPKSPIQEISAISGGNGQAPQDEGLSLFDAVLDSVNPLQHIPGVSTAYRAVTGDESSALANMAGGFLFGGPVGMAAGAATSFLEMLTGKSILGHAMSFFGGEDEAAAATPIDTTASKAADPLLQSGATLSLAQYQAFATAQADQQKGYGSDATVVGWSSNIWTDNALKQAAGLYEDNQKLGDTPKKQNESIA